MRIVEAMESSIVSCSEPCIVARTLGIVGRALRLRKAMEPCAAAKRSLEVYISHRKKLYSV